MKFWGFIAQGWFNLLSLHMSVDVYEGYNFLHVAFFNLITFLSDFLNMYDFIIVEIFMFFSDYRFYSF